MRALGWRRDRPDPRDKLFSARLASLGRRASTAATISLRSFISSILDQGDLPACVAHAGFQAIRGSHIRQLSENMPISQARLRAMLGSRHYGHYFARAFYHETYDNVGTELRLFFKACADWGFPPEELWPYDDDTSPGAHFTREPSKEAQRAAFDQKGTVAYHRIGELGDARLDAIDQALSHGFMVTHGCMVTEAFCENRLDPLRPLPPPGPGDIIAGGHAMVLVGRTPDGYDECNSWNDSFGAGGYYLASPEYVKTFEDLWAVETVPLYSEDPS